MNKEQTKYTHGRTCVYNINYHIIWYPSSQICHACGTLHPEMKDLKIRTMRCDCGLVIGRDQNAAINILNEGLRILATQ